MYWLETPMIIVCWRALLDSNQWPSASEISREESTTLPKSPLPSSHRPISADAGSQGTTSLPRNPEDFVTRLLPERRAEPPLLTVRQVAERLGVCTATVYRLCDRGQLTHVRVLHAIRIAPADLTAFIQRRHCCVSVGNKASSVAPTS